MAEAECSIPVATVDHVYGDDCAGGCESSSGNLAGCQVDGDAALSDHWNFNKKLSIVK